MISLCLSDNSAVQGQGRADQKAAKECFMWENKLMWIPGYCVRKSEGITHGVESRRNLHKVYLGNNTSLT